MAEHDKHELNITGGARLMRHLGNNDLKGWQCVAELIDNSIDGLLIKKNSKKKYVEVYIPTPSEISNNSQPFTIDDNGKGMNKDELENALTAGMSGNDDSGQSLGLFGLGFNSASARLGDELVVRTSREDMDHDLIVRVNLIELSAITREDKTTRVIAKEVSKTFETSGTEIKISQFLPRSKKLLNRSTVISYLNKAYSSLFLEKEKIKITINGNDIKPYKFCIWNEDRFVETKRDKEKIPVYHSLDNVTIGEAIFSKTFNTYVDEETAKKMDEDDLVKRKITINGWVGLQRFFDTREYGINVIRNGRIILLQEKDKFFNWYYPEDFTEEQIREHTKYCKGNYVEGYPIDNLILGGRIVGEIHADFIHPNFTKDGLENESDLSWQKVVNHLRGDGPFQPDLGAALGYEQNTSPLGMLFKGFRKANPKGRRYLIGGDGSGPLHARARAMAQYFFEGKEEYQDDSKWHEMVEDAEIGLDPDEIVDPTDLVPDEEEDPYDPDPEKNEDPFHNAKKIDEKEYDIKSYISETPIKVLIYKYKPKSKNKDPISFLSNSFSEFNAYININNDLFKDFTDEWEDLILLEVASIFHTRKGNDPKWQLSSIYYELKKKYQKDSMLNKEMLITESKYLIEEIQGYLVESKKEVNLRIDVLMNKEEIKLLKDNYLRSKNINLDKSGLEKLVKDSSFLEYMEQKYIFKYISLVPENIFDDNFFNLPYSSLDDEQKTDYLSDYLGYLKDIEWFIYKLNDMSPTMITQNKEVMIRNRVGLRYLNARRNQ